METHRAAVEAALGYMERSACWARRGKGGRTFVPGQGCLAAAPIHRSSRAGDPQLHTHLLVANATLGPDGRWSRLYHPAIYEHARTASYLYAAHLRHELTIRLGVEWEPVVNGLADIRGFSKDELRAFSTRRAEILAAVGEGASAKAMRVAALETRKAKDRDLTDESLREGWRVRAEEIGLTRERIADRLGHERPGSSVLTTRQVERSTANVSHFDRRDAIRTAPPIGAGSTRRPQGIARNAQDGKRPGRRSAYPFKDFGGTSLPGPSSASTGSKLSSCGPRPANCRLVVMTEPSTGHHLRRIAGIRTRHPARPGA